MCICIYMCVYMCVCEPENDLRYHFSDATPLVWFWFVWFVVVVLFLWFGLVWFIWRQGTSLAWNLPTRLVGQ